MMIKSFKSLLCILAVSGAMFAEPVLQLDILGGAYDLSTETIVAEGNGTFSVFAYLNGDAFLGDKFFLSAAITPKLANTPLDLGNIKINGLTYNVTKDMAWGVPPLEANLAFDPGDLSKHGIFETFFCETGFKFNSADKAVLYNTQDLPGQGPTLASSGSFYYKKFDIDVSGLKPGYTVHFDLYNERLCKGDIDVNKFAPFSHDAEIRKHTIPEPSSLLLLLLGLTCLTGFTFKRKKVTTQVVFGNSELLS
jgi:hypothetical protein